MKPSPDNFLSQHRIRYDGSHFQGTPGAIVAALIALNGTRSWDTETGTFVYNQYETPDFKAVATNPNTFAPSWVIKERKAMENIHAAVDTGKPEAVYAAVDALNAVRGVKGGGAYVPPCDFDIIAHGRSVEGEMARLIVADRTTLANAEALPSMSDQTAHELSWFDSREAFDALNAYAAS